MRRQIYSREQIRLLKPTDPQTGLPSEFVTDCVVWSAFAESSYAVSLRNVQYQGRVWQIANQVFPFLLEEVRRWPCGHGDIASQLAAANEDRFLAKWLAEKEAARVPLPRSDASPRGSGALAASCGLSPEAWAVLDAARRLYREFYANICHTPWMDWKIETWDVGYYQIRNAMKNLCDFAPLREKHDALRAKLLPQIYSLGFLNPDVEYFTYGSLAASTASWEDSRLPAFCAVLTRGRNQVAAESAVIAPARHHGRAARRGGLGRGNGRNQSLLHRD